MGYDYVIRISVDSLDGLTKNDLKNAYEKFKNDKSAEFFFGCEGHGGSRWISCGGLEKYFNKLTHFTSQFPTKTFIFYNHCFDYETMEIIAIKNTTLIFDDCINMLKYDNETLEKCKKYNINIKDITSDENDENDNKPTNITIKNELSGYFSNSKDTMSGGLCFGPTCRDVSLYLHELFIDTIFIQ
jgi:hypothetical protein